MSTFTIYPAIDLKGGHCVRLLQGRADAATVYGSDPVSMARRWMDEGATALHLVDLDGAFQGHSVQAELMARIIAAVPVPVQCGGGLRTDDEVARLVEAGAARVILGTRAWSEPDQVKKLVDRYGAKLAVGIDARGGLVQVKGWTETTNIRAVDLARQAEAIGVATLIVTDTATDGMLGGTNVAAMEDICMAVKTHVIASGGVSAPSDVKALRGLGCRNLVGAIVGKALYEGHTTLAEMNAVAR